MKTTLSSFANKLGLCDRLTFGLSQRGHCGIHKWLHDLGHASIFFTPNRKNGILEPGIVGLGRIALHC